MSKIVVFFAAAFACCVLFSGTAMAWDDYVMYYHEGIRNSIDNNINMNRPYNINADRYSANMPNVYTPSYFYRPIVDYYYNPPYARPGYGPGYVYNQQVYNQQVYNQNNYYINNQQQPSSTSSTQTSTTTSNEGPKASTNSQPVPPPSANSLPKGKVTTVFTVSK